MPILSLVLLLSAQLEEARREQVMQWSVKADAAACQALEGALTDASSDIRGRAALALYSRCDRARAGQRAAKQLCRSVDLGNASAAAFLLLGYAAKADAEACLSKKRPAWLMVKLGTATRPVPAPLAATVALARLGDAAALAELRAAFAKNSVDQALFLLAALPDIEDPQSLQGAVGLLSDARPCQGVKAHAPRKVRDAAADALIERFRISPLAGPGKRYSDAEIAAVRAAATVAH